MIRIFRRNALSIPIEIVDNDGNLKDLTGLIVKAGVKKPDGTITIKDCIIEGTGSISLPLTQDDTEQVGIYVIEILLMNSSGYKETWGIFGIEVRDSITVQVI